MVGIPADRYKSPAERWANKEERASSSVGGKLSWRERSVSPVGEKWGRSSSVEVELRRERPIFGCMREERLRETARIYGNTLPEQDILQKIYKELKTNTNKFIEWLIQKVFPGGDLPNYITICRERPTESMAYMGSWEPENALLTVAIDHPKYEIPVNDLLKIADLLTHGPAKVPFSILSLLNKAISLRTESCHWSQLQSDNSTFSRATFEKHQHFIDVLEEVKRILTGREGTGPTKPATTGLQRTNSALGKRKSSTIRADSAVSESPKRPMMALKKTMWREVVANTCEKTEIPTNLPSKRCTPILKPKSYAAALSVSSA